VIREDVPLFMVRHSVRDQLLRAAQTLLDDRLNDADALAQVAGSMTAILAAVERVGRSRAVLAD
jgi:hypothetical protein